MRQQQQPLLLLLLLPLAAALPGTIAGSFPIAAANPLRQCEFQWLRCRQRPSPAALPPAAGRRPTRCVSKAQAMAEAAEYSGRSVPTPSTTLSSNAAAPSNAIQGAASSADPSVDPSLPSSPLTALWPKRRPRSIKDVAAPPSDAAPLLDLLLLQRRCNVLQRRFLAVHHWRQ